MARISIIVVVVVVSLILGSVALCLFGRCQHIGRRHDVAVAAGRMMTGERRIYQGRYTEKIGGSIQGTGTLTKGTIPKGEAISRNRCGSGFVIMTGEVVFVFVVLKDTVARL